MSNRLVSDGVVSRALHFLGYDTARIKHFLLRNSTRDKLIVVEDAIELGFDVQRAIHYAELQSKTVQQEKDNDADYQ